MQMFRNFLEKLNRIWYEKSRVTQVLTIRKGSGMHTKVTVMSGTLYFHSLPFSEQLIHRQEIVLDGMRVEELVTLIQRMGYTVDVMEKAEREGILKESALVLLEVTDRSLNQGETLFAFTSNLWRVLYPVHRILVKAGNDVDEAVEQLLLPSARGEWLDYWVSFLQIKRLPEESDEMLLRRAFMSIASVKANDVAIEELISYYIDTKVQVLDYMPNIFEVRVTPEYMASVQKVRDLVKTLKGAGVDYILNYAVPYTESYQVAFRDKQGKRFNEVNESYRSAVIDFGRWKEDYSAIPEARASSGFILNKSRLNGDQRLSVSEKRIIADVKMVMTLNGVVVQEM